MTSSQNYSIAIETSCRAGGLTLALGERCIETVTFDTAGRHATALISQMKALLDRHDLSPVDLAEAYVSAGPGSFTGLRVGITAVRTLAQALGNLRCVAVPTAHAVARNATDLEWTHLGVIMAAREGSVHATLFERCEGRIVELEPGRACEAGEFLAAAPKPVTLIGEGLTYQPMVAAEVTVIDPEATAMHMPNSLAVWQVGLDLARAGTFTEYHHLLPIYPREPEAIRLWKQQGKA